MTRVPELSEEFHERYDLKDRLGAGASSVVHLAVQRGLRRMVIVKILFSAAQIDRRRFHKEAQILARIDHPGVVRLLDFGFDGSVPYMVYPHEEGRTLRESLRQSGSLPWKASSRILRKMAVALREVHGLGVLHRDIKPENIFLNRSNDPLLLDFGLGRHRTDTPLTLPGTLLGTVGYSAPEQLLGRHVDDRADLYSLGIVGHEMLTGSNPYKCSTVTEVMRAQLNQDVRDLDMLPPSVPPWLRALVLDLLERDPEDRPPSAASVLEVITRNRPRETRGQPRPGVRPPTIAGSEGARRSRRLYGGGILLFLLLLSFSALSSIPEPGPPASPGSVEATAVPASPSLPARDLMDREAAMTLIDPELASFLSRGMEAFRDDPLLMRFSTEVVRALEDVDQRYLLGDWARTIELWTSWPLDAEACRRARLTPLGREEVMPAVLAEPVPASPRYLLLKVRSGGRYRLEIGHRSLEFRVPGLAFTEELRVHPGRDAVLVSHFSLADTSEITVMDERNRESIVEIRPRRDGLPGSVFSRFGPLDPSASLVILLTRTSPEGTWVLSRREWRMPHPDRFQDGFRAWVDSMEKLARGTTYEEAGIDDTLQLIPREELRRGLRSTVAMGKDFVDPRSIRILKVLAEDAQPEVRRGALHALGLLDGPNHRALFFRALEQWAEPEDWIQAVEALHRAGDPRCRSLLLERLQSGPVGRHLRWIKIYAQAVPMELDRIFRDPAAVDRYPPESRRLIDQIAAYTAGTDTGPHLSRISREHALGANPFSVIMALRLASTSETLHRLEELAMPR